MSVLRLLTLIVSSDHYHVGGALDDLLAHSACADPAQEIVIELTFENEDAWMSHGNQIEAKLRQHLHRPFLNAHLFEMVKGKTCVMDRSGKHIELPELPEPFVWQKGQLGNNDGEAFLVFTPQGDTFPVKLCIVLQEKADLTRYTESEAVFDALAEKVSGHHPVRLLRMSWLLQFDGGVLKRRQELPEEAFVSAEQLLDVWEKGGRGGYDKALPIVTISFCWDTRDHPDPTGQQLELIVDTLRKEQPKYTADRSWMEDFTGFGEMGIFWDWPSLLQGDPQKAEAAKQAALAEGKSEQDAEAAASEAKRTPGEKASFGHALHETMDLWYAHQGTQVFLLTQHPRDRGSHRDNGYEESGWTTYERCSAEQIKKVQRMLPWDAVLELGGGGRMEDPLEDNAHPWRKAWRKDLNLDPGGAKKAGRRWPVGPDDFDEMIQSKSFTNGSDCEAVKKLFRKMSGGQLGSVKELDFQGMPSPEPADMARLGRCLLLGRSLDALHMEKVRMGDKGFCALAAPLAAAPRVAGPPLPALRTLMLRSCALGAEAAEALAAALFAAPALRELYLGSNNIDAAGVEALGAAFPAVPALERLDLSSNVLGVAGAAALAAALPATPNLTWLTLGGRARGLLAGVAYPVDALGAAGVEALVAAFPAVPALRFLDLQLNELGDAGAAVLGAALPTAPALDSIWIFNNGLSEAGRAALRAAWAPRDPMGLSMD